MLPRIGSPASDRGVHPASAGGAVIVVPDAIHWYPMRVTYQRVKAIKALLDADQIENYLRDYYGVENIIWLGDGIVGDDTDGHVDDLSRFVAPDTIVTVVEEDAWDENYEPLQKNLRMLNRCRLANGKQPTIVELPMPDIVFYDNQRLPASYANFYIANGKVIFPTYRCLADNQAAYILEALFPDREIIGIDSTDIIWGLGSFHCLSQQMPSIS